MVRTKTHSRPNSSSSSSASSSEEEDDDDVLVDQMTAQRGRGKNMIFGRGTQPPPSENSTMASDDVTSGKGGTSKATNSAAAAARAGVFDALRVEMEFAEYARGQTGQRVKRVPRNQAPDRTIKRRALQEADMMEMAIEVDEDDRNDGENKGRRKRLRGSKVGFDSAVLKSMPALPNMGKGEENAEKGARVAGSKEGGGSGEALNEDIDERYEVLQEVAALGIDLGLDEIDKLDDDYEEGGEENGSIDDVISSSSEYDESGDEEDEKAKRKSQTISNERANVSVSADGLVKPKKRLMHRLREFTSIRLAEKHGEAIGAHIRGASETAVQKLREVARSAPGAPQVYSSLGMVFESMLTDMEGQHDSRDHGGDGEVGNDSQSNNLQRRMELAKKAYASYHVASLLTIRDFVLWERSGDAAIKVAFLYSEIIVLMRMNRKRNPNVSARTNLGDGISTHKGFDPNAGPEIWRSHQKLWMEHALSAYDSSDKLRPPGVDVPCKLAQCHMALGNYIDALSILTDLRNKASGESSGVDDDPKSRRSEMEGSYPCWLLYADLMMRIGYECKQWSDGASTSQNYMFKRWLKKNSKDFDWGERRLQALCLALEAAAGSSSCTKIIGWMRKRAEKFLLQKIDIDVENDNNSNTKDIHEKKDIAITVTDKEALFATKSTYEDARDKLIRRNKMELQLYDRKTKEMNLVEGSHIYKNRIASRAALIETHGTSIKELARNYTLERHNSPPGNDEFYFPPNLLPIQGSFATVYDITALLLKQCIELKLFDGGLLAVQSVLDYSKERVSRLKSRTEREHQIPQSTEHGLVQSGFNYDQINFESDSDDEDLDMYISDEDKLEQSGALQPLERSSLPLDIRAMHAICLLGVGGQDYVALNFVDQVIMSNEIEVFSNDEVFRDDSLCCDPSWFAFSKHFNAPVNKSFVLACVANLVSGEIEGADHSRSKHVLRIFRKYLRAIDNNHGKNQGIEEAITSSKEPDRAHTMKVLLATLNLMIHCTKNDLAALNEPYKEEAKVAEKAVIGSMYTLQTMLRFHHELWKPRYSDWSLPDVSIDMVRVFSGALSILVQVASISEVKREADFVRIGLTKARHLVSTICHGDSVLSTQSKSKNFETLRSFRSFPLPCLWQTSLHVKISLRAYNLCVACCVSAFSGWEPSEFNLDNLRSSEGNFFGVTLDGQWVAGFLAKGAAYSVAEQWARLSDKLLPELEVLPFERHLEERKRTSWYQNVMGNIEKQSIDSKEIQSHGEDDGIKALLSFSSLCLHAAERCEGDEKDELLGFSLSILLPITQFCIDKQVWDSTIGSLCIGPRNNTKVDYYLDENCNWLGPTKTQQGQVQVQNTNKTHRLPRPSKVERPNRQLPKPSNILRVPTSVLHKLWTADGMHKDRRDASKDAQNSMKAVDNAMKNLRKSRTLNSLERASIDVAVALIGLTAHEDCENPFVCLQQAAMFAGLGSKRGNNDDAFKRFLPLKNKCTPLEALNILGRSDCLRAIHFLHEAQYLCAWVASVCHSHRDRLQENLPWNSRWSVIGITTYTVSTIIEETSEALKQDNPDFGALREWDDIAIEEIRCGKYDALNILNVNSSHTFAPHEGERMLPDDEENRDGINDNGERYDSEKPQSDMEELALDDYDDDYDPYEGVEVVGV